MKTKDIDGELVKKDPLWATSLCAVNHSHEFPAERCEESSQSWSHMLCSTGSRSWTWPMCNTDNIVKADSQTIKKDEMIFLTMRNIKLTD